MKKGGVIIFDVDGVLFDSVDLMHQDTLHKYPTMTIEDVRNLHSKNIFESLEETPHPKREENEEEANERTRIYSEKKSQVPMYPGMKNLLQKLSKDYILIANTSAMVKNCMPMFEKEGIVECFNYIGTKEIHKSKIEKFKIFAEKYNTHPEEMIFVTDTLGDLVEATELNIPTIAVTWGVHDHTYFSKEKFKNLIAIVDTPEQLEQVLTG